MKCIVCEVPTSKYTSLCNECFEVYTGNQPAQPGQLTKIAEKLVLHGYTLPTALQGLLNEVQVLELQDDSRKRAKEESKQRLEQGFGDTIESLFEERD